jgi:diacylglycerol kinase family enzyme
MLAQLIDEPMVCRVDVGTVGDRRFLLMASLGIDAAVVQGVATRLKRTIGRWAYALTLTGLAAGYRGAEVRLALDGREVRCTALMVLLGNTRRYAGRFRTTPLAIADDGMLDIVVLQGGRIWEGLPQAGAMLAGIPALRRSVLQSRARLVEIDSDVPLPIQVDGDFYGFTPARFEVIPRALHVLVGPGRAPGLFSDVADEHEVGNLAR